jgi:hypothetical protein
VAARPASSRSSTRSESPRARVKGLGGEPVGRALLVAAGFFCRSFAKRRPAADARMASVGHLGNQANTAEACRSIATRLVNPHPTPNSAVAAVVSQVSKLPA